MQSVPQEVLNLIPLSLPLWQIPMLKVITGWGLCSTNRSTLEPEPWSFAKGICRIWLWSMHTAYWVWDLEKSLRILDCFREPWGSEWEAQEICNRCSMCVCHKNITGSVLDTPDRQHNMSSHWFKPYWSYKMLFWFLEGNNTHQVETEKVLCLCVLVCVCVCVCVL